MASPVPFGRYFLLETLATGGMAELFLAKSVGDGGFEKLCVLKRVLPHLGENSEFVEMFLDEARLAAQLNHPSIVQIFDFGRVNDAYFFAMEYLVGEDVSHVLRRAGELGRELSPQWVAGIVSLAADALHYAHTFHDAKGKPLSVVHRDISPFNLFVTYSGAVKVLDFGIARAESRIYQTREGQVRGKLHYMSPEQANGQEVDARTDVWALGVCLYELLTGKRPFVGETLAETTAKILVGRHVPVLELRPSCPPKLAAIVERALQPSLSLRYASADELRRELETACAGTLPTPALLGATLRELMGTQTYESKQRRTYAAEHTELPRTPALAAQVPETTEVAPLERSRVRRYLGPAVGLLTTGALVLTVLLTGVSTRPVKQLPAGEPANPSATPAGPVQLAPTAKERALGEPLAPSAEPPEQEASADPSPRPSGRLDVDSNVPATVFVGARRLGSTPLRQVKVPLGAQTVRLLTRTGAERSRRVEISSGAVSRVHVVFSSGTLNVLVKPWADVYVDGRPAGQTPIAALSLVEGHHSVRLVSPNAQKTVTVEVQPGKTAVVNEHLP